MSEPGTASEPTGSASRPLFAALHRLIEGYERDPAIAHAAELTSSAIVGGGLVHLFGTGHSSLSVQDTWPRIGGYVGWNPIVELGLAQFAPTSGVNGLLQAIFLERVEGYAQTILDTQPLAPPDALVVVSHSGINAVPVEVALLAAARGVRVIAITCVAHSRGSRSRHPSGHRLCDIAEVVLDTRTPIGDATATVTGFGHPVGAVSTIAAATLLQALVIETAERLGTQGCVPDQIYSHNHSAADDAGHHDTIEVAVRSHALLRARRIQEVSDTSASHPDSRALS